MNLDNYPESHGKVNIIIFVLIDLKREIEEVTLSEIVKKATYTECTPETKRF